MKYRNILLYAAMHFVLWMIGTAVSETAVIPGETVKLTVTGLIILAVYAAGTLYFALRSEKNELIILEIWKICLLAVFAMISFTNEAHGVLPSFILLGPFRPLILVNLRRAFLISAGVLIAETVTEVIVGSRSQSRPA